MFGKILDKIREKTKHRIVVINSDWLDTPEGQAWEAMGVRIYDELENTGAKVSVDARKILWEGKKLTVNQAVVRLTEKTSLDRSDVREHLLEWLEEAADVKEREDDDADDDVIDQQKANWLAAERKATLG